MLRHWGFAVFLLTIPIPTQSRPTNAINNRQRRSVGHAQMMHDRSRSLHDRKRRTWIQELLEQVHTAQVWDSPNQSEGSVQTPPWPRPKHTGSTKNLPLSFQKDTMGTRDDLPQETSKSLRYEEQPLKSVTKRKSKMCRRRDRACVFHMQMIHMRE